MSGRIASVDQPHPDERTHLWDYRRPHHDAPAPVDPHFPRTVYRAHTEARPEQIDHPGIEAKSVADQAALDAALADGWLLVPPPTEAGD